MTNLEIDFKTDVAIEDYNIFENIFKICHVSKVSNYYSKSFYETPDCLHTCNTVSKLISTLLGNRSIIQYRYYVRVIEIIYLLSFSAFQPEF